MIPGTPRALRGAGFRSEGPPKIVSRMHSGVATGASVSTVDTETSVMNEHQASAGAQSAPTALLHPWTAAVTLPLSPSMQLSCATD
jgi:hypothetical protein